MKDNLKGLLAYNTFNEYLIKYCKSRRKRNPFWKAKGKVRAKYAKIENVCSKLEIPIVNYINDLPSFIGVSPSKVTIETYLNLDNIKFYSKMYKEDSSPDTIYYQNLNKLFERTKLLVPSVYPSVNELLLDTCQPFDNWFRVIAANIPRESYFEVYYEDLRKAVDYDSNMTNLLLILSSSGMLDLDALKKDTGLILKQKPQDNNV